MKNVNLQSDLEKMMADPCLVELCELQRTGDEVLDVISLSENQHSDILAWLLDAKEGHGQGDEILRDLLVSASTLSISDDYCLEKNSDTAKFFSKWPPARMRTTSFGSAFTARELGILNGGRIDLCVIDEQNKFIVLIENKAGAAHTKDQLDKYRGSLLAAVEKNERIKGFNRAYIALDREFDGADATGKPSSDLWLHLGYEWLKTSATRALMHVARGNAAARLVVSYCNRQTEWDDPNNKKCLELAAGLYQAFPNAMKHLVGLSKGKPERKWLSGESVAPTSPEKLRNAELHLLFVLQNKSAVTFMKEVSGMASVKSAILEKIPALGSENFDLKRVRLHICPTGWENFAADDGGWPVHLTVKYADAAQSKYRLTIWWYRNKSTTPLIAENLRLSLTKVNKEFEKHPNSDRRAVVIETAVDLAAILKRIVELDKLFTDARPIEA